MEIKLDLLGLLVHCHEITIPPILHALRGDAGPPRQYRVPVCFVLGCLDHWYLAKRDGVDAGDIVEVADNGFSDFEIVHFVYVVIVVIVVIV